MSAEAYLRYLLINAPYEHPFRPDGPVPCPGCFSSRFHREGCDAGKRWSEDARRLFVREMPPELVDA